MNVEVVRDNEAFLSFEFGWCFWLCAFKGLHKKICNLVFKLECLKIKTKLNHFALRTKLLISANQSAFAQLKAISGA